jgi:phage gpG-like protein
MTTQITMNVADVERKLDMVAGGMQKGMITAVAEWLRYIIRTSFQNQRSPEGVPWKPLKPASEAAKPALHGKRQFARVSEGGIPGAIVSLSGRRILERTGALFNSIDRGIVIQGSAVTAASTLPYAAIHQYGGTVNIPEIRPRSVNGTLRWFGAGGEPIFAKRVRAHRVTIPARPYLPSPEFAEREAAKVVDEGLQDAIKQAGAA